MSAYQAGAARVSSTVTKRNPRPRKYATASERQAAYRDRAPELCFRAEPKTVETINKIVATRDYPRAAVLLSMVKFALANHDWARFGPTHKTLPYGYGVAEQEFIGPRLSNPSPYADQALWESAKAEARKRMGGHSARAMQLAGRLYRAAGGRYLGKPTKAQKSLERWTDQDWTTKSGKSSRETGERYLPREVIEELTPAEYGATTRAKRKGTAAGQQFVKQPARIAAKVATLKANPTVPTIYTVKPEYLIADAERIERDAKESLNAWILLGQSEKYSEAMKTANMLRQAAATKSITTRREILRNAGFTVKTPKQVASSLEGEPRKENPTMKKPTPAQLAARARFAEMARSGAFKRKIKAKKAAPKKTTATYSVVSRDGAIEAKGLTLAEARKFIADKAKRTKRFAGYWSAIKTNPAKKTVSQKISQLTREGYPQKQAVAIALSEERAGKVKRNPRASNPITETLIYGLPAGETRDYMEDLLYDGGLKLTPEQIQKVLDAATAAGYHSFRVTGFDPTVGAAFVRTMGQTRQRKRNPATGTRKSRTKLNPKPRMAKIAFATRGGQTETIEVPIDFAFKEYIGNIQQDFFARKQKTKGVPFDALVVSEKSTGYKVGVVPRTLRSVFGDRAAAKQFVQDLAQQVGAEKFNAQIALKPKIA